MLNQQDIAATLDSMQLSSGADQVRNIPKSVGFLAKMVTGIDVGKVAGSLDAMAANQNAGGVNITAMRPVQKEEVSITCTTEVQKLSEVLHTYFQSGVISEDTTDTQYYFAGKKMMPYTDGPLAGSMLAVVFEVVLTAGSLHATAYAKPSMTGGNSLNTALTVLTSLLSQAH